MCILEKVWLLLREGNLCICCSLRGKYELNDPLIEQTSDAYISSHQEDLLITHHAFSYINSI